MKRSKLALRLEEQETVARGRPANRKVAGHVTRVVEVFIKKLTRGLVGRVFVAKPARIDDRTFEVHGSVRNRISGHLWSCSAGGCGTTGSREEQLFPVGTPHGRADCDCVCRRLKDSYWCAASGVGDVNAVAAVLETSPLIGGEGNGAVFPHRLAASGRQQRADHHRATDGGATLKRAHVQAPLDNRRGKK